MKILIVLLTICFFFFCILFSILYTIISRNHLKNIFYKLSTNPAVNPRWFFALSLREYPDDIITKIRFINRLIVIALLRNLKRKKNKESYQVITKILSAEELRILSLQGKIIIAGAACLFAGGLLNWLFPV